MRYPLWMVNSSMLILLVCAQLMLFMFKSDDTFSIKLDPAVQSKKVVQPIAHSIDISSIYENDLFGTYHAPMHHIEKIDETVPAMPEPPAPLMFQIPEDVPPEFFEPLAITLKGIVFVSDDQSKSLAIIQDNATKEEQNYEIGDLVEDAQILKIFANRVIFIRSNGQQETVYLREDDAASDFAQENTEIHADMITQKSMHEYYVDIDMFAKRVPTLGMLFDLLDITTVFKQGKVLGLRIGHADMDTLGDKLGFEYNDVVTHVDGKEVVTLEQRMAVYDVVVAKYEHDTVKVTILRGGQEMHLTYILGYGHMKKAHVAAPQTTSVQNTEEQDTQDGQQKDINSEAPAHMPVMLDQKTLHELEAHKKRLLAEREKLAPTLKDLTFNERRNMLLRGQRNVILGEVGKENA